MLVPSIFSNHFADSFFNDSFGSMFEDMLRMPFEKDSVNTMHTDVKDLGSSYQMEMELPGYEKEDLQADLKDGYLTILAEHTGEKDERDEEGRFVCRERFTGRCQRSFYVGENVTKDEIHANFENGVLKLMIPKKDTPAVEERKYIAIE